jgi:hypothetical protein
MSVQNILDVYSLATPEQIQHGLEWYKFAHSEAVEMAKLSGLSVEQTSAIIAVISPQCSWTDNLTGAWCAVSDYASGQAIVKPDKLRCLDAGFIKAQIITDSDRILPEMIAKTPDCYKVRRFFTNIFMPETSGGVTVDGHARNIAALGAKPTRIGISNGGSVRRKEYLTLEQEYIQASKSVGLLPHEIQAITWVTWRTIPIGN